MISKENGKIVIIPQVEEQLILASFIVCQRFA